MKKLLSLLLTLVLVVGLFAACGQEEETTTDTNTDTSTAEETKDDDKEEATTETADDDKEDMSEPVTITVFQNKVEITEPMTAFAEKYEAATGVKVEVKSAGGGTSYADSLIAAFQTDEQPDIFVIEGMGGYEVYKEQITPFDGDEWIDLTDLEFVVDGNVYGFPVAVEAWGMGYNVAILEAAGIDPAGLTSQDAYAEAFAKIDSMKDELGLDAVVSMAAGTTTGMTWVTGLHNFNGFLSAGLPYGDTTELDKVLAGEPNMERLAEYADWVELLFQYADPEVLIQGDYDAQVGLFGTEKAAFIHQGNWIDPWLVDRGIDFDMAYAPHASVGGTLDSIFIGAPSFYVMNKNSENLDAVRDFLNYMATNEQGHDYMVNQASMVPAFTNVTLSPAGPLSSDVSNWVAKGKAYTWLQNDLPAGFGMDILGPIYEAFAKGDITKEQFINAVAAAIADIPNM